MNRSLVLISSLGFSLSFPIITQAQTSLYLAYPAAEHNTTAAQIFFIGTAPTDGEVLINDQVISRSEQGHFAPSFPLKIGENKFTIRYGEQTIEKIITRTPTQSVIPQELAFGENSLIPQEDMTRLRDELICFGAIAPGNSKITVEIGQQTIPLFPQTEQRELVPNAAIYTPREEFNPPTPNGYYQGCTSFDETGFLGHPVYTLSYGDRQLVETAQGEITIVSPNQLEVIEISSDNSITRTGPSTDYSRLTPLPFGTRAKVTAKQGEWLRLDYGAWIKQEETRLIPHSIPPQSHIRLVKSKTSPESTEIIFPLQTPIPFSIQQGEKVLSINLYNTIAQTDTIRFDDHFWLKRLDWQQVSPNQVQYNVHFKDEQQWGYNYRYEDSNLIVTINHPPRVSPRALLPLQNVTIVLDPGHGGKESGAIGPTGYPEKDINLLISRRLADKLRQRGATVYLTRETDQELSLQERVDIIEKINPAIALSIHYNALPDDGDAVNTMGVSTFWYHPQAHSLAVFLHNHLVHQLQRPDYGVYWNNLALTRTHAVPTVLLELGFIINPVEFEWITNPQEQDKLVETLSEGIVLWFRKDNSN